MHCLHKSSSLPPLQSAKVSKPALQRNLAEHTADVALQYIRPGPDLDHKWALAGNKNRSELFFYPVSAECHCMFFDFGLKINEVGCFCHYCNQELVSNWDFLFASPFIRYSADRLPGLPSLHVLQFSSRWYQATAAGDSLRAAPRFNQCSGDVCLLCKRT